MTTETTTVARPEYFTLVHRPSGQHLTDAYYDHKRGQWVCEFDHEGADTMTFATREAARQSFISYHCSAKVAIMRHPEVRKVTDEGRAAVAARRAARNADRKW